jgi:hypothetical protein
MNMIVSNCCGEIVDGDICKFCGEHCELVNQEDDETLIQNYADDAYDRWKDAQAEKGAK